MGFVLLGLGLVGLWFGAELAVKGALDLARRFNFSHAFVGLTILSIGTDVPELFIMLNGSVDRLAGIENSGLLVGQVLGSSISQIGLVAGICAIFATVTITKDRIGRDGLALVGAVLFVALFAQNGELTMIEGGALMLFYIFYLIFLYSGERGGPRFHERAKRSIGQSVFLLVAGLLLLHFSSEVTVVNAMGVSESLGITQTVVGVLIIGLGTSLPELATAIYAGRNEAGSMAAGNLIGSSIFDLLFVLGMGSAISGLLVSTHAIYFDIPFLLAFSLLFIGMMIRNGERLGKKEGFVLVAFALFYGVLVATGAAVKYFGLVG